MNVAIIAAGGHGTRVGGERAKQFQELAGIPIIIHTLKTFELCDVIHEIIVVLPAQQSGTFLSLTERYALRKVAKVVPGGATRSESVLRGLQTVRSATAEIVAIHDAVRPFVSVAEIDATVKAAAEHEAAVLVAPVSDTIKRVADGRIISTVERDALRRALTPQCFRYSLICRAYEGVDVASDQITDESILVERLGVEVRIVEGSTRNIKITRPEDLVIGEALLRDTA